MCMIGELLVGERLEGMLRGRESLMRPACWYTSTRARCDADDGKQSAEVDVKEKYQLGSRQMLWLYCLHTLLLA